MVTYPQDEGQQGNNNRGPDDFGGNQAANENNNSDTLRRVISPGNTIDFCPLLLPSF